MNEDYEDALTLANLYCLNSDVVYARQWQSYPVTTETIEAYLVGVHACVHAHAFASFYAIILVLNSYCVCFFTIS